MLHRHQIACERVPLDRGDLERARSASELGIQEIATEGCDRVERRPNTLDSHSVGPIDPNDSALYTKALSFECAGETQG